MSHDEIIELHSIMEKYCLDRNIKLEGILAFLISMIVSTIHSHGYTQEEFENTCDRMKIHYKIKLGLLDVDDLKIFD